MDIDMKKNRKLAWILPVVLCLLNGCSDLVEVQDRDFILAMGISEKDGMYEVVLANPDFGKDTKAAGSGDEKEVRSYQSAFIGKIEEEHDRSSDKRLDYKHLEAMIIDESLVANTALLHGFIEYLENSYAISRNVLLFYYPGKAKELFEQGGTIGRSIGDFIEKLSEVYTGKYHINPITIGNFIQAAAQDSPLSIPVLAVSEDGISMDGAAVFYNMGIQKLLTEQEWILSRICKGEGGNFVFYVLDHQPVLLQEVDRHVQYRYEGGELEISLSIIAKTEKIDMETGIAEDSARLALADQLEEAVSRLLESCMKEEGLDICGFYDLSAIKNREIWMDYAGSREAFLKDLKMAASVRIK